MRFAELVARLPAEPELGTGRGDQVAFVGGIDEHLPPQRPHVARAPVAHPHGDGSVRLHRRIDERDAVTEPGGDDGRGDATGRPSDDHDVELGCGRVVGVRRQGDHARRQRRREERADRDGCTSEVCGCRHGLPGAGA